MVEAIPYVDPQKLCYVDPIRQEYRLDFDQSHGIFLRNAVGEDYSRIKPYLRPMSSMTEEEKKEMSEESNRLAFESALSGAYGICPKTMAYNTFNVDYCLSHHLDYRGLIEKGLALEAPEGMYKTE